MTSRRRYPTLRAYLKGTGQSQRGLARTLGVHQSTVSMLVAGRRSAGGALARLLHELTGVPLESLLAPLRSYRGRRRKRGPPPEQTLAGLS